MTDYQDYIMRTFFDDKGTQKAVESFSAVDNQAQSMLEKIKETCSVSSVNVEQFSIKTKKGLEELIRTTKTFTDAYGNIAKVVETVNKSGELISLKTSGLDKFGITNNSSVRQAQLMESELSKYTTIQKDTGSAVRSTAMEIENYNKVSGSSIEQANLMNSRLAGLNVGSKDYKKVLGEISGEQQKVGITMGSYLDMMKRAALVAPAWMLIRQVIQGVTNTFKDGLKFIIDWETKMAEIRIVGNGTAEEYAKLSRSLLKLSTDLGVGTEKIAEGAKILVQAGYDLTAVVPLMETVSKISMLTGRSVADSVEDIISLMKNYKIEAQDTGSIVDKLVMVEINHAVTTKDLVEALRLVAPVATQAHISLERMLGVITSSIVATRRSGSEIARSWITIITRMGSTAVDAIQNIAKIPMYVDATGKAVRENTGTMRPFIEVLDEMAISWTSLGDVQQKQLAKGVAGVRQTAVFMSAMQQWKEGIDAAIESMNAFGKSDKAIGILLETTKSQTEQLTGAWHSFVSETVDTGLLKEGIGFLKTYIEGLASISALWNGSWQEVDNQRALNNSFKETNKLMLEQRENISNAIQLSQNIISLENFRNRLIRDGASLDDKRIKDIDVYAKKMATALSKNEGISGFSGMLEMSYDKWISFLKSKQPELTEALLSKEVTAKVIVKQQEILSSVQTITEAYNKLGRVKGETFTIKEGSSSTDLNKAKKILEDAISAQQAEDKNLKRQSNRVVRLETMLDIMSRLVEKQKEFEDFDIGKSVNDEKAKLAVEKDTNKERTRSQKEIDLIMGRIEALSKKGYTNLEIAQKQLDWYKKHRNELDAINSKEERRLEKTIAKLTPERQYQVLLENENDLEKEMERLGYSKLSIAIQHLAFMKEEGQGKTALTEQQRTINNLQRDYIRDLRKDYIAFGLDIERIMGVNQITILKQQISLASTQEEKTKLRLDLEKEITKQKQGQASFTDRETKLYEISQKYGLKTAQDIADLFKSSASNGLQLEDINKLKGKDQTAFTSMFADLIKNLQMTDFFKNNPSLEASPSNEVSNLVAKAQVQVDIKDINFKVDLDSQKFKQQALDALSKALDDPNNDIFKKIESIVDYH